MSSQSMFSRLTLFLLCLLPVLLASLYRPLEINNAFIHGASSHNPARILLLTAHPDDESYFFAPTILALLANKRSGVVESDLSKGHADILHVYSLCLSTGDADGHGERRIGELSRSLDILGVDSDKRWIASHPKLQDNITTEWDPRIIAKVVEPYIRQQRIDTILTFDDHGVSGHANHRSIPAGIIHLLSSPSTRMTLRPLPRLYTLVSVSIPVKFTGLLAPLRAKLVFHVGRIIETWLMSPSLPTQTSRNRYERERIPLFISGINEFLTTLLAIRQHESQLLWFRWLYTAFAQYMWVNQWVEVKFER